MQETKKESGGTGMSNVKGTFVNKNFNVFKMIWKAIIKPMSFYNEDGEKLSNGKNTAVYVGVIAIAAPLVALIITFISTIFSGQNCVGSFCVETSWADRLEAIDWWPVIWQNFVFPIVVSLALASIFYLGVLVAKKEMKFVKMVSLAATALLPYMIADIVLIPILSSFWAGFTTILSITALLYTIALFFNFVKHETDFKDKSDGFMYYWLACSAVVAIAIYVIVYQMLASVFTGGLF